MDAVFETRIDSPIGPIFLAGVEDELHELTFRRNRRTESSRREDRGPFRSVIDQLDEYFAGTRKSFDVTLAPKGTDFQLSVWEALRDIPFGTTISYGLLARRIGKPAASRAVGAANGRNPISIIVPCHRVIGSDGSLTGYGGGLDVKRRLLTHEGAILDLFPEGKHKLPTNV